MATTTILFTDISDSTRQLASAGDERGSAAITAHLARCREIVALHGGRVAKSLGDGVMCLFPAAYAGVEAAIALQQSADHLARSGGPPFRLRIGVHVGDVIDDPIGHEHDVFGLAVVIARRICDVAQPGQVLASDLVRQLMGSRDTVSFVAATTMELSGVPDPQIVHEVPWSPLPAAAELRVVVAEDAALIRAGIVRLLGEEGFTVVADVGDREALMDAVRSQPVPPDLVVTDIRMPPTHTDEGLSAAAELRAEFPGLAVVVLSQHVESSAATILLDSNPTAVGYVLKERISDVDEFLATCRQVADGGTVIDPIVADQLVNRRRGRESLDRLTERELEVLELMAGGSSNKAIAAALICSDKTVESHVGSIFTKLDLGHDPDENRRVGAVVRFLAAGG